MNCRDCQELILTDYLDNQMEKGEREKIEGHLSSCPGCREFAFNARKTVMEPFEHAQRPQPPESVWHNIKEAISDERSVEDRISLLDKLRNFIAIPKPAMAFVMIVVLLVAVKLTVNSQWQRMETAKGAIEDISYVIDEIAYLSEENGFDELTDIEEYFL